jgi:hypothetical protein
VAVRYFAMVLVALLTAAGGALADTADPAVAAMFREWSLSAPSPSRVVICHGFGCAFHTEIALTGADRAQMAAIMASGSASAQAERAAIGRTEAWFERRIAPVTGTALRVARAGPLIGGALNRGQFDCIDTTNNTNSLLLVLDQLKLLRHHTIAAPASRFLLTEGPHNTAVIKERKTSALWTVDPWTHKGSEVPDIFPLALAALAAWRPLPAGRKSAAETPYNVTALECPPRGLVFLRGMGVPWSVGSPPFSQRMSRVTRG